MIFNKEIFHKDNLLLTGKPFIRNAYRAVIFDSGKLLMVYSVVNREFKFPGGGREPGESVIDTIIREVKEEVGYSIKKIHEKVGIITEYNIAQEIQYDFFKMVSEYYFVIIDQNLHLQKLDDYEEKLKFEPKWINIKDAYEFNTKTLENNINVSSWIRRETLVLEELLNNINILENM
jgi:8-oxo-dGTP pyrophosphatase MutT (NUDIX family)